MYCKHFDISSWIGALNSWKSELRYCSLIKATCDLSSVSIWFVACVVLELDFIKSRAGKVTKIRFEESVSFQMKMRIIQNLFIAFIYNIYVRRTSRCENWHFSKCGDIQRRICYAFVIAWLHCFHIWVCQYLASKQRHATLSFLGWRLTCQDSRDLYHFNTW